MLAGHEQDAADTAVCYPEPGRSGHPVRHRSILALQKCCSTSEAPPQRWADARVTSRELAYSVTLMQITPTVIINILLVSRLLFFAGPSVPKSFDGPENHSLFWVEALVNSWAVHT